MQQLKFPLLTKDQIAVRVGTINEKGATLLLYKNSRTDMDILDEVCGQLGWQRDHKELKGVIYCGVGIFDKESNTWIWKWDAGDESNVAKEKGESSDSFKRACTAWGLGRELYSAPFIWVPAKSYKAFTNSQGKLSTFDKFSVAKITYTEDRKISGLAIKNDSTQQIVFLQKPSEDELLEKSKEVRKEIAK